MKKRAKKQAQRIVPAFATEAEEAEWWYKNRHVHGKQLQASGKSGEAQPLTADKLKERVAASKRARDAGWLASFLGEMSGSLG